MREVKAKTTSLLETLKQDECLPRCTIDATTDQKNTGSIVDGSDMGKAILTDSVQY